MKQKDLSPQTLGETLCAVILLQRVTPLQVFEEFLDLRKAVIIGLLSSSKSSGLPVADTLCETIALLQSTMELVDRTFIGLSDPSLLEKYLG